MPKTSKTKTGTRKLSEVARHVVVPQGITSTGWPRIAAQCRALGIEFEEWQDGIGRLAFAKRADGAYAASVGGTTLSIPRQVGKTFLIGSIAFALCLKNPGTKVIWTAHHSNTADETLQSMAEMAERPKIAPHVRSVLTGNSKQRITFRNRSRIEFGAREHGFGRGKQKVSFLVLDEAQQLSEAALENMLPSMNRAENPLLFMMGTPPKPENKGDVFTISRSRALSGKAKDAVYVEFSADPDADLDDQAQWAVANPSFPHFTPVDAMLRMREKFSDDGFRREALGIWDETKTTSVIPLLQWGRGAREVTPEVRDKFIAVDVRTGLEQSYAISMAARADGDVDLIDLLQFEWGMDSRPSESYIVQEVRRILDVHDLDTVVVDSFGDGNGALLPLFAAAGIRVLSLNTADMRNGSVGLRDAIVNERLIHPTNEFLTTAVKGVGTRKSLEGFIFAQDKSTADITPLRAATAAWWAMRKSAPASYNPLDSVL